jgi:hypothetical protein
MEYLIAFEKRLRKLLPGLYQAAELSRQVDK